MYYPRDTERRERGDSMEGREGVKELQLQLLLSFSDKIYMRASCRGLHEVY